MNQNELKSVKATTNHINTQDGVLFYKGTPVREMGAYPPLLACRLLGMGRTTFWEEVSLKRLTLTRRKLLTKFEFERYLREEGGGGN
jgi:hypothetical protein